ncbi:MAG: hypothetical protein IKM02_05460 [Clostridia bacterium]|nr:hypothetical protein [Clostridia bacterium]
MNKECILKRLEALKYRLLEEERLDDAEAVMMAGVHLADSAFYSDEWLDTVQPQCTWEGKAQLLWSLIRWNVSQKRFEPAEIVAYFRNVYGAGAEDAIRTFIYPARDYLREIEAQAGISYRAEMMPALHSSQQRSSMPALQPCQIGRAGKPGQRIHDT